tara:strand:- start:727 stop:1464 length:738 start_codon:yes stop_codon:yes gene_type:complete
MIKKAKKLLRKLFNLSGYDIVNIKSKIDFYLHEYESYEQYKKVQIHFNQKKIDSVWADKTTMHKIGEIVKKNTNASLIKGICHGTRNGYEQNYLNENFKGFEVIGTDISPTAVEYKNSLQWDFHDENKEWSGKFDFVYSNSLDQSWKPAMALETWLNQLKKNGVLIVEHSTAHGPLSAGKMDPFGVKPTAFCHVLAGWFGHQVSVSYIKQIKSNYNNPVFLFVIKRVVDKVISNKGISSHHFKLI